MKNILFVFTLFFLSFNASAMERNPSEAELNKFFPSFDPNFYPDSFEMSEALLDEDHTTAEDMSRTDTGHSINGASTLPSSRLTPAEEAEMECFSRLEEELSQNGLSDSECWESLCQLFSDNVTSPAPMSAAIHPTAPTPTQFNPPAYPPAKRPCVRAQLPQNHQSTSSSPSPSTSSRTRTPIIWECEACNMIFTLCHEFNAHRDASHPQQSRPRSTMMPEL